VLEHPTAVAALAAAYREGHKDGAEARTEQVKALLSTLAKEFEGHYNDVARMGAAAIDSVVRGICALPSPEVKK
jgi:hypothetical protein